MTHSIVGECCIIENKKQQYAGVAELADALDLGSSAARRVGSSPTTRTIYSYSIIGRARRLKSTMDMGSSPIGSILKFFWSATDIFYKSNIRYQY